MTKLELLLRLKELLPEEPNNMEYGWCGCGLDSFDESGSCYRCKKIISLCQDIIESGLLI